MRRGPAIVLVLALAASSCHRGVFRERYIVGGEIVVHDFGSKVQIYGTALLPMDDGGMLAIWSDAGGVWSVPLASSGSPMREPARVSRLEAAHIAAVHLGADCVQSGHGFALVAAPRVSATEGNASLELMLLGLDGRRSRTIRMLGKVGPYTSHVTLAGDCDGVLVGWHQGSIGDFSSRVALVDAREGVVVWEQRLSDEGASGFCPGILAGRDRFVAVWGEVRPRFRDPDKEPVPDPLMFAALDRDGGFVAGPRKLLDTFIPSMAPTPRWHRDHLAVLYKDYPIEATRDGIYMAFVDPGGGLVGEPRRIGRGDGPDHPLLLSLPEDRLATAVVRTLSFELLVGVNYLDSGGEKLSGEVQIYAHKVRFRRLSAVLRNEEILLHHVEQGLDRTRLLITTLRRSS